MSELENLIVGIALFFAVGYGIAWLAGGKPLANRYAKWVGIQAKKRSTQFLTWFGQRIARLATRYPLPTGIVVVAIIFMIALAAS